MLEPFFARIGKEPGPGVSDEVKIGAQEGVGENGFHPTVTRSVAAFQATKVRPETAEVAADGMTPVVDEVGLHLLALLALVCILAVSLNPALAARD